jgi:16S rRNA (cytosine1402-N4)-methyltransferase
MTASSDSASAVAGGPARHIPVLVSAAVKFLNVCGGGIYVDATFGGGGYSREILKAAKSRVIAIDRDASAITAGAELARESGGRLLLIQRRFADLRAAISDAGHARVDGVVFDLGVSSMQLDDPARGFSLRQDGPLDMRMGNDGSTVADILACISEQDLGRIIATLGEERHARAIARALVRLRERTPIRSTRTLADAVAAVVHGRPGGIHPATRTFQALRIFVNDELSELASGLDAAEQILKPGGRLVAVAFHSLEDRIVKSFLAQRAKPMASSRHLPQQRGAAPTFELLTKRPMVPDEAEVTANLRARSAKLRAAARTDAAARTAGVADLLPRLPSIADVIGRGR